MITSPRLTPVRNVIRLSSETSALRSTISRWVSTAQRTVSTTLGNSTSMPSPVVLTMRPRCSLISGSRSWRRCALLAVERASLVGSHQPRVSRHIGGEDRGKTAFDGLFHDLPQPRRS